MNSGRPGILSRPQVRLPVLLSVLFLCSGILTPGCSGKRPPRETTALHEHNGDRYYEAGDFDSALREYSKALEMGSQKLKVYNNLGNVYFQRGQYEVAERYYRQALDIDPAYLFSLNNLALALLHQHRYRQAGSLLTKALTQSPGSAVLYNSLALVNLGEEDMESAAGFLKKAVEINPDYSVALNNLGDLYLKNPELGEDPLPYIKRAIEKDPENMLFYDSLGWYYFRNGIFSEALIHLGKAFVQDPDNLEVRVHYAEVLEWLGKEKEALEQWEAVMEMSGDQEMVNMARRHYWEIKGR